MSSIAKSITTIVCAIAATSALAQQQQRPALIYDRGGEVVLQLRHSWKSIGAKQAAAKAQGSTQGKAGQGAIHVDAN